MKTMKNFLFLLSVVAIMLLTSCESVQSGHKGVEISWGGETNMKVVHPEGLNMGIHWLWDDLVEYDVREKTITEKFEFNDRNNMKTPVAVSIDYKLDGLKANVIHSSIGKEQLDAKIMTTLSSAAKQVIPQYSASELNLSKRDSAETQILAILVKEFPAFFVSCSRVRITDVDIPQGIADAAEATAKQAELNKLALSKGQEAENNYKAAEWDAKTKDVLSQPAMLKLKELEIEMTWAQKGVSKYGTNNVFGATSGILLNR